MVMDLDLIKNDLKNRLKPSRYQHVLGVLETGLKLNEYYQLGLDEKKLAYTCILHDCAKGLEKEYFYEYKDKYDLKKEFVFEFEFIAHAILGAIVAKERYGIEDEEILQAIRWHVTGRVAMNDLEKLLALSDYVEPNRTYESCILVRSKIDLGLDKALLLSMNQIIEHLLKSNAIINIETIEARNYLQRSINE